MTGTASASGSSGRNRANSNSSAKADTAKPDNSACHVDNDKEKSAEAVYYFVKNSLTEKLCDKNELKSALCLSGRNPSNDLIDSLWNGAPIGFPEFCDILSKLAPIDEKKLSNALSKLSPTRQNFMPRGRFVSILSSCGEPLPEEETNTFLNSVVKTNPEVCESNGNISFLKLSRFLVKAAKDAEHVAVQRYNQQSRPTPAKRSSKYQSDQRKKSSPLVRNIEPPSNLQHWIRSSIKGAYFLDDDEKQAVISHHYKLELNEDTSVYFTMRSTMSDFQDNLKSPIIDTRLIILSQNDNSSKAISFTYEKNNKEEYVSRVELKKGSYTVIPFTTGCRFRARESVDCDSRCDLIKMVDGKPILLDQFIKVLSKIFTIMDVDGNDLLSREEFNLFNWRTSGEEVADDEWAVVQDNFELKNDELTLKGFLDLHQMEAEDNDGDADDLWVTLCFMGFNSQLMLDQVCPFLIEAYTPVSKLNFKVLGIKHGGHELTKALTKFVIEHGNSSKVKKLQDLTVYELAVSNWCCIIVQNKSNSVVSVQVDCSNGENCFSHQLELCHVVTISPKSTVIAHHLMPIDDKKYWNVDFTATIIR